MDILINNRFEKYKKNLKNENGKIQFSETSNITFPTNVKYIVPGFIDQHIHGVKGYDVMDGTFEAYETISKELIKEGVTSFFPTTMTTSINKINEVLDSIKNAKNEVSGAEILGVHLEGPFINEKRIGAQNPLDLEKLTVSNLKRLVNLDIIKMVTYAPELDKDYEFINYLNKNNIIASVGHSNATCNDIEEAYKNGLRCFTHLYNAMSEHSHKSAGVVTAAYLLDEPFKELIVDGHHVNKEMVKATYKNLGSEKINLITDSIRAKSMDNGIYDLGGQDVEKFDDKVVLKGTSTLAGSVLKMNDAIKNMLNFSQCTLEEAFQMASFNQAQLFELNNKGLISNGYDFDITCLDENFNVIEVYKGGEKVYDKKNN